MSVFGLSKQCHRQFDQSFAILVSSHITAFGRTEFQKIASLFARQYPPESPVINQYGDIFPTFLEGFEPLEHLPYLAATARLELALRRSYHAADSAFVHPSEFEALSPEGLKLAQLKIAPHAFLIRSSWPIYSIWQYNTKPNAPKPPAQAPDVLVVRPNFAPHPVSLPPGSATLFESLQQGLNFFEAANVAQDQQTDFDLAAVLALFLSKNVLSEIIPKANKRRLL